MGNPHLVIASLLLLLGQCTDASPSPKQRFLTEPKSTSVLEGGDLVLECSVADQVGELQWTRDDFGLGTDRELVGYSRYKMVGADLHISNVSLAEDDAKFQCQVGATEASPPLRSRYAIVQVVAPPQPPVITAGPRMLVRAGRRALVQCISKGGRPPTQIRWRRAGQLVTEGVEEKVETLEDGKRSMTVSTLTFLAGRNLSGTFLECEARSEVEGAAERRVGTTLEVEFEPRVELVVDKEAVFEGDMVRLACKVEARPQLVEYQWWVGGNEVEEARGAAEFLLEAARKQSGQMVTCLARNRLGQGSADYKLEVHYSPAWLSAPKSVTGSAGERVELECAVDAHPAPSYTWRRDGNLVGKGSLLTFPLSSLTTGRYTCTATVPGFSPLIGEANVLMRSAPQLKGGSQGLQGGAPGETLHIQCEARAVPPPSTFIWSYKGAVLRGDSPVYSMIETQHGDSLRSTLIINSAREEHFGDYECLASNEVGKSRRLVRLRPEEGPPLLVVVSAGIAGLLLTTVVLALALACRRYHTGKGGEQWGRAEESCSSHSSLSEDDSCSLDPLPADYQQFTGSKDLLASLAPTIPYSSPYLQSSTPTLPSPAPYYPEPRPPTKSPTSSATCSSPAYGNLGVHCHDGVSHRHDTVAHSHDVSWVRGFTTDVGGEELNSTSIGTHV